MPIIQLTPQLQHTVHKFKSIELQENASTLLDELSLSKEESSAVKRTFITHTSTRKKELTELGGGWL